MFLGIDIGTSSVKAVLIDAGQTLVATSQSALQVSRPYPGWSEQDPAWWLDATLACVDQLKSEHADALTRVESIGLSGQMHGATLLDGNYKPLRPCILWNDGRAADECRVFESACPRSREISGNLAMPGLTAPKLLWVRKYEPEVFKATRKVLLPKDYIRFKLCGETVSDVADAAGTLWLDVGARAWSQELLDACGLDTSHMPDLVEGSESCGVLSSELCQRWGMTKPPVIAGGAGDNAAGAIGAGVIHPGSACLTLGTSGVVFVATDQFNPNTDRAVHTFCHAIPDTWHQTGVILSAASCFEWLAKTSGTTVSRLMKELEHSTRSEDTPLFLPYLSGERTPHNDTSIRGAFLGLSHSSERGDLARAVAEGVGFALKDCVAALAEAGSRFERLVVAGGGSRSSRWLQILADILDAPIDVQAGGESGAAFGAARLAILAATGKKPEVVCRPAATEATYLPSMDSSDYYGQRWARFDASYPAFKEVLSL